MDPSPNTLPRSYVQAGIQLLLFEAPAHGYELARRLTELGVPSPDKALVYRALRDMENEGLVVSHWEPSSGGPFRRTYSITPDGATRLSEQTAALRDAERALTSFLERFDGLVIAPRDAAA